MGTPQLTHTVTAGASTGDSLEACPAERIGGRVCHMNSKINDLVMQRHNNTVGGHVDVCIGGIVKPAKICIPPVD